MGAECFVVPAAFTVPTGEAHWDLLLRARAVENLCHLVAPAQVGVRTRTAARPTAHSAVVDCWGARAGAPAAGDGRRRSATSTSRARREVRPNFPALEHRVLGRTIMDLTASYRSQLGTATDDSLNLRATAPSWLPAGLD